MSDLIATGASPDTYGIPEYFATETFMEVTAGTNVRMICGVRRGSQVNWLFSVVMPAPSALASSVLCRGAAEQAFNLPPMLQASSVLN